MPITSTFRNDALDGVSTTNNVTLYSSTDVEIATVSVSFGRVADEWFATGIEFDNIAAGTIIGYYQVFKGTSSTTLISEEAISGTESERTIGDAGGRVVLDIQVTLTNA